jgi:hypothetical protein
VKVRAHQGLDGEREIVMEMDTFYVKGTFYVRPEQTLVLVSVVRRVGGPGSGLWGAGWRMGVGGRGLADVALQDMPHALMTRFCTGEDARLMSPEARRAWMSTWRGPGIVR